MRAIALASVLLTACIPSGGASDGNALPPAGEGGDCDRPLVPCPPGWTYDSGDDQMDGVRGRYEHCISPVPDPEIGAENYGVNYYPGSAVALRYSTRDYAINCDDGGVVTHMRRREAGYTVCWYACPTCEPDPFGAPECDDEPPIAVGGLTASDGFDLVDDGWEGDSW